MAKIKLAVLESIKGSIGNVTFYVKDAEQEGRKGSANVKPTTNTKVLTQQLRFKVLAQLAAVMAGATRHGFTDRVKGRNTTSMFVKLNKDTVTVEDLEANTVTVAFGDITCARGYLAPPSVTVTRTEGTGTLAFESAPMTPGFRCEAADEVYVVVINAAEEAYDPEKERQWSIVTLLGTRGEGGSASVPVPSYMTGGVHAYAFAVSADGKMASDSIYLPIE